MVEKSFSSDGWQLFLRQVIHSRCPIPGERRSYRGGVSAPKTGKFPRVKLRG